MRKFVIGLAAGLAVSTVWAGVPNRIVYQGRLSKSGVSVSGPHTFVASLMSAAGEAVWSSGNINVTLPATGDFSLLLEPTGVDWVNDEPKLSISVDGEALNPADTFASSPYSLVALRVMPGAVDAGQLAEGAVSNGKIAAGAGIDPAKVAISGDVTLADWRSAQNPEKIDANVIQGTIPVSTNQIPGTALVANCTYTQLIEPAYPVLPLAIKPQTGTNVDILELRKEDAGSALVVKNTGNVGIGTTDVPEKLVVNGRIKDKTGFVAPPGSVTLYAGSSAPEGWLVCDGAEISRAAYADLFTAIGTNFGPGNGATTFNLPDLRGRAPIGTGAGPGLTPRTLGQTAGEETHALTVAELAAHSHTQSAHAHDLTSIGYTIVGTGGTRDSTSSGGGFVQNNSGVLTASVTPPALGSTGSGSAHNVLQPSLVMNFIIKF